MRIVLLPHNPVSEGAANLAAEMNITRIKREKSRFKYQPDTTIINWGCTTCPTHIPIFANVINKFENVAKASDKLVALDMMQKCDVPIPEYTTDRDTAMDWYYDGNSIVVRHILNGHAGKGIEFLDGGNGDIDPADFPHAPLYVSYIPKKSEYRVHVVDGNVIDVTRKTLKEGADNVNVNWKIRNLDNGFIFSRYNKNFPDGQGHPKEEMYVCPNSVKTVAKMAVEALGLDFGAVDVIWNEKYKKAYVLEVNTAPGIADTATERYAHYLRQVVTLRDMKKAAQPEMDIPNPWFKEVEMRPFKINILNGDF